MDPLGAPLPRGTGSPALYVHRHGIGSVEPQDERTADQEAAAPQDGAVTDDGQCDPRNRQRDEENSRARKNPLAVPPAQQPETGLRVLARFDGPGSDSHQTPSAHPCWSLLASLLECPPRHSPGEPVHTARAA